MKMHMIIRRFAGAFILLSLVLANYHSPYWLWFTAFVGANLNGRSAANAALGQNAILRVDGYTLLDLRAGIGSADDRWKVSVWGRNLTDDAYITTLFPAVAQAGSLSGYRNQPRTYGVEATMKF